MYCKKERVAIVLQPSGGGRLCCKRERAAVVLQDQEGTVVLQEIWSKARLARVAMRDHCIARGEQAEALPNNLQLAN